MAMAVAALCAPQAATAAERKAPAVAAMEWAEEAGALLGWATACGYDATRAWYDGVRVEVMVLAKDQSVWEPTLELMDDVSERAYTEQKNGQTGFTCDEVIAQMKESEKEWQ